MAQISDTRMNMDINTFLVSFRDAIEGIIGGWEVTILIVSTIAMFLLLKKPIVVFKSKIALALSVCLIVAVSLAEVPYYSHVGENDPTWFLSGVGAFFSTLFLCIVSSLLLLVQYRFLALVSQAVNHHGGYSASNTLGCLAYVVGILGGMVIFWIIDSNIPAFIIFGSLLVAQIVVMFKACKQSGGNYLMVVLSFLLYVLGVFEILFVISRLIGAAFFFVAIYFLLKMVGNSSGASTSTTFGEDTITDGFGGTVYGSRVDRDNFFGGGNHYVRTYEGLSEVWRPVW